MKDQEKIQIIHNAVTINGSKPATTSLKIAEVFGKQHKDVLKAIESLQVPDNFRERNFAPSEYTAQNGIGKTIRYPMYNITRDGFTILAMGFTGKAAMQFKIAYIEAFNRMEAILHQRGAREIVAGLIQDYGSEWILERLQRCELLEAYAPLTAHNQINKDGFCCATVRRGSNPIRGGRKISSLLSTVAHEDLFVCATLRELETQL